MSKIIIASIIQVVLLLLSSMQVLRITFGHDFKDRLIAIIILTLCVAGLAALQKWRAKSSYNNKPSQHD